MLCQAVILRGWNLPPPATGLTVHEAHPTEPGCDLVDDGPHEESGDARGCRAVSAEGVVAEEDRVDECRKSEQHGQEPGPSNRLAGADAVPEAEP